MWGFGFAKAVCEDNFMGNPFDEVQVLVPHSKSRVRALEVLLDRCVCVCVCLFRECEWTMICHLCK